MHFKIIGHCRNCYVYKNTICKNFSLSNMHVLMLYIFYIFRFNSPVLNKPVAPVIVGSCRNQNVGISGNNVFGLSFGIIWSDICFQTINIKRI